MNRRSFTKNILSFSALAPFLVPHNFNFKQKQQKRPVIIDTDTANEIDDLYAVVRMVLAEDFEVLGLCSAQWQHQLSPKYTVLESQRLNDDLLRIMNRQDIPAPLGSELKMGKPWGGYEPADSAAAQLIITETRSFTRNHPNEKLTVICLGALTNIASAIALAPEIVNNIEVYALGGKYFSDKSIWDKDEFNVRRDFNAFNFMLNTENLALHIMPINILYDFVFKQSEVTKRLSGKGAVWNYLVARWKTNAPNHENRVFWDLALALAVLKPSYAKEELRKTPPENNQRDIWVYTKINEEKMFSDWWNFAESHFRK
ncbi:nucleoside hydrolase [Chondrinema litorale]|uniref:nucleoside hydrolase n=1 Tax=Chondrinema litorale TaxID=2994555 RepID=UPI002543DD38|nr:nucleoside hydrolase [Chondrinema litorale]UZR92405.1 nucleoside hydrolase [Chondrinema litorale]